MKRQNPCLRCGACCASFRVSFYWAETDETTGGSVPVEMATQISPLLCAMRGTDGPEPRCLALQGTVGSKVRCLIYRDRPSTCYEFAISGQNGNPNDLCDLARQKWGLQPLTLPQHCLEIGDRNIPLVPRRRVPLLHK